MTIEIDGSEGEGGGQILRTALTLSMCTGVPVQIRNIRAKRKAPGLMRQHLTAVNAAAEICGAETKGAQINSSQLYFAPGALKGGDYRFSIGTAGSCTLVLQTVLPALLMSSKESQIVINGGTHNTMSPPFHFLQRAFIPLLQRMGADVELQLNRFGFYPAGSGEIVARIKSGKRFGDDANSESPEANALSSQPIPRLKGEGIVSDILKPLHLPNRGECINAYAESYFSGLPAHIAERELSVVKSKMTWGENQLLIKEINRHQGPGNVLLINLEHEHVTEVFTGFAERGVAAETVAKGAVMAAQKYLASTAAVGPYLADQLLLPMALAGSGSYTTTEWSKHAASHAKVIKQFLPVIIVVEKVGRGELKVELSLKGLSQ